MSKVDSIKEEIGWLKVMFAVTVALVASLAAWLAQNYDTAPPVIVTTGFAAAWVLAFVVVYVTRRVHRLIKDLEDA